MRVIYLSITIVFIDQISKLLVKGFSIPFFSFNYEGMYHGQRIPIINDFFRLTFIENPGMAFGLDPGSSWKLWISVFSIFASIGLVIYLYVVREQTLSLRVALALILGGAIGNLIDRVFYGAFYDYAPLFYGKVVDFLDVDFFNFTLFGRSYDRWPIFNIADAAVTIGVLVLLIFYKKHNTQEEKIAVEVSSEAAVNRPDVSVSGLNEELKNNSENKDRNENDNPPL